jgi:hypothetical protein
MACDICGQDVCSDGFSCGIIRNDNDMEVVNTPQLDTNIIALDRLIIALKIFGKYMTEKDKEFPTHCEHDVLQVSCHTQELTADDLCIVQQCDFFWDKSLSVWCSFHYGSA